MRTTNILFAALLALAVLPHLSSAAREYLMQPHVEELVIFDARTFYDGDTYASTGDAAFSVTAQVKSGIMGGYDGAVLTLLYHDQKVCTAAFSSSERGVAKLCPDVPSVQFKVVSATQDSNGWAIKVNARLALPPRHSDTERIQTALDNVVLQPGERKRFLYRENSNLPTIHEYALTWMGRLATWQAGVQVPYTALRVERDGKVEQYLYVNDGKLARGMDAARGASGLFYTQMDSNGALTLNGYLLFEPSKPAPNALPARPSDTLVVDKLLVNGEADKPGGSVALPIMDVERNQFFRVDLTFHHSGAAYFENAANHQVTPVPNRRLDRVFADLYLVKDDAFQFFCMQNGGKDCSPTQGPSSSGSGRLLFDNPFVSPVNRGGELFSLINLKLIQELADTTSLNWYPVPSFWVTSVADVNLQRVGFVGSLQVQNLGPGESRSLTYYYPSFAGTSASQVPKDLEVNLRHLVPGRYKLYVLFRYQTGGFTEQYGGQYYQPGTIDLPEVPMQVKLDALTYGDVGKTNICDAAKGTISTLKSGGKPLQLSASATGVPGAAVLFTIRQVASTPRKEDDAIYSHVDVPFDAKGLATFKTGDEHAERDPETGVSSTQKLSQDAFYYYPGNRTIVVQAESNMQGGVKKLSTWSCDKPLDIEFNGTDYNDRITLPPARYDRTLQEAYVDYAVSQVEAALTFEDSALSQEQRAAAGRIRMALLLNLRTSLVDQFVKPQLADRVDVERRTVEMQNAGWWRDILFLSLFSPEPWNKFYSKLTGETTRLGQLRASLESIAYVRGLRAQPLLETYAASTGNFYVSQLAKEEQGREQYAAAGTPRFDLPAAERGPLLLETGDRFLNDGAFDRANQFYQTVVDLQNQSGCCSELNGHLAQSVQTLNSKRRFYFWTNFAVSTVAWVGCSLTPAAPACAFLGAAGLGVMAYDLKTQWSKLGAGQRTLMLAVIVIGTIANVKSSMQSWSVYKARLNGVRVQNPNLGLVQAAWTALKSVEAQAPNQALRASLASLIRDSIAKLPFGRWLRLRASAGALSGAEEIASLAAKARAASEDIIAKATSGDAPGAIIRAKALDRLLRNLPADEAGRIRADLLARLGQQGEAARTAASITEAFTGQRGLRKLAQELEHSNTPSQAIVDAALEDARGLRNYGEVDARFLSLFSPDNVARNIKNAARYFFDMLKSLRNGDAFHYVFVDIRHLGNVGLNLEKAGYPRHLAEYAKDIVIQNQLHAIQDTLAGSGALARGATIYRVGGDELAIMFPKAMNRNEVENILSALRENSRIRNVPPEVEALGFTQRDWAAMVDLRKGTNDLIQPSSVYGYVPREQVDALLANSRTAGSRVNTAEKMLEELQYTAESALKRAAGKDLDAFDSALKPASVSEGVARADALSARPIEGRINVKPPDFDALESLYKAASERIKTNPVDKSALRDLLEALNGFRNAATHEAKFQYPNFYNSAFVRNQLARELRDVGEVVMVGVELNHLKDLNSIGYAVGDSALDAAARAASESVEGIGFACRVESKRFLLYIPKSRLGSKSAEAFAGGVQKRVDDAVAHALERDTGALAALKGAEGQSSFTRVLDSASFGGDGLAAMPRTQALINELGELLERAKAAARTGAEDPVVGQAAERVSGGNAFDTPNPLFSDAIDALPVLVR